MSEIRKRILVKNPDGLHMRPASILVRRLSEFSSDVEIVYKGKKANAKSILNLLSLGISSGAEIEVIIKGEDAEKVIEIVEGILNGEAKK